MTARDPIAFESTLACPACNGSLSREPSSYICALGGHEFAVSEKGIPLLYWPTDDGQLDQVTDSVKDFYEDNPFPSYDAIDSAQTLESKARAGFFARLLSEQIPYGDTILEVGCGTGQLSNYLGLGWGRSVVGADLCLNSLHMGEQFRKQNDISQVKFCQMNLFRPPFEEGSFDLVISNGVLHHTSDPRGAFESIASLVRPTGYVIIGLYNRFGRVPTFVRRQIFRASRGRFRSIDPHIRATGLKKEREDVWFADQYLHPKESSHTIDEVLEWFTDSGFEFVSSIPKPRISDRFSHDEKLFERQTIGTRFDRLITQLGMLFSTGREGGLFIVIGQKS